MPFFVSIVKILDGEGVSWIVPNVDVDVLRPGLQPTHWPKSVARGGNLVRLMIRMMMPMLTMLRVSV